MALTPASGLSSTLKDLAKRFMSLFARNPGLVDNVATKTDVDTITSDLASTSNAKGASCIGIEDSGGLITATTVEGALAELAGSGATRPDLILGDGSELTIASGAITVTAGRHLVDTESDGASDDLDTINGLAAGEVVFLTPADAGRTVVVKHGTGNIHCPGGADISLAEGTDGVMVFSPDGTNAIVMASRTLA